MYMHNHRPLSTVQKRAIFAACAAAVVAMDNSLGNSIFAYIVEDYPQVPHSTLYLFQSIGHVIGMIAAFIVGPLTMRVSPKRMIQFAIAGMIGVGMVYLLFGGKCPYWVMIACAAVDGMESSIISCLPAAVVAVHTNNIHQTVKYSGYVHACTMGGGFFFSLLGGCIGSIHWQWAYSLYLIAVPILLVVMRFMPDDMGQVRLKNRMDQNFFRHLRKIPPIALLIFLQYFLFYVCAFTYKAVISEYIVHVYSLGTSFQAGVANSVLTLVGGITGIFFGRASHVLRRWLVPALTLMMTFGYLSMAAFTTSMLGCMLGTMLLGVAKGGMMPAVVGELSLRLPEEVVPLCVSALVGFMNLGMASSTYIIDPLAAVLGAEDIPHKIAATLIAGLFITLTAAGIFVAGGLRCKEEKDPNQPLRL